MAEPRPAWHKAPRKPRKSGPSGVSTATSSSRNEPARPTLSPCAVPVGDEASEVVNGLVPQQPAGGLVGGVQHHAEKTCLGQAAGECEIGRAVGHQHRHQPDAGTRHRRQVLRQDPMIGAGKEAELDDVHAGGGRRLRRDGEAGRVRWQVAHRGADGPAPRDQRHGRAQPGQRPRAERAGGWGP